MVININSLQTRLAFMIFIIILPGIILLYIQAVALKNDARHDARQKAVVTVNELVSQQLDLINKTKTYLTNLATFPEVMQPDSTECSTFLSHALALTDTYINLGVPRLDGELICNALPLKKRVNVADRPYIRRTIATGTFSIGEFQLDRAADVTSINLSYPVINPENNEMIGVAVAVISLEWWSKQLSKFHLPEGTVAYITDSDNIVIAHYPSGSQIGNIIDNDTYETMKTANSTVSLIRDLSESKRTSVFKKFLTTSNNNTITVSVSIPFDKELAVIDAEFRNTFILLSAFMVLIFFMAWLNVKTSILAPIKFLIESTRNLEKGKYSRKTKFTGAIELIKLQERFSQMAEKVKSQTHLIKQQEKLYHSVIQDLPAMVCRNRPDGIVEYVNDAYCDYFGLSREQLLGNNLFNVIPETDREIIRSNLSKLNYDNPLIQHEYHVISHDGIISWQRWTNRAICDQQGNVTMLQAFGEDITEQKKAQEELIESERRLSILIGNLSGMVYRCQNQFPRKIIFISESCLSLTGFSSQELMNGDVGTFAALTMLEDMPHVMQTVEQAIIENRPYEVSYRIMRKNGDIRWVWERGRYVTKTIDGPNMLEGMIDDITEQKLTEMALKQSEERFNFALQRSHTGFWELSLIDHTSNRSFGHDQIFGYESLLPEWTYEMFLDHVIPEDRADVDRRFSEATKTQTDWNFDCRIRRKDGLVRWIWAVGGHDIDTEGQAKRMLGVVQDITERKQTEIALAQKELEQREILAFMFDSVITIDQSGKILSFNKAAELLFGYRGDEIIGQSINKLLPESYMINHGDYLQHFIEFDKPSVLGVGREVEGIHKNKTVFPMHLSVNELPEGAYGKRRFICSCNDLSQRKIEEE